MSEGENEKRERAERAPRAGDEPRVEAPPSEPAQEDHAEDHAEDHVEARAGEREGIDEEVLEELKAQVFESDGDDLEADAAAESAREEPELTEEDGAFERGSSAELADASHEPERPEDAGAEDGQAERGQDELEDSDIEEEEAALPGDDNEARGPGLESALHLEPSRRKSVIESVIFVADKPINERQIAQKLGLELDDVRAAVADLIEEYGERGVRLDRISGGLLFRTSVDNAPFVRKMKAPPPVRMTRAQLETLSIVAYRQPVTRPEVDEIRGVDSGSALKVLADRELVRILGRKEEPGRPLLYGTTTFFLEFFGLNSLRDLPTLKEFSDLNEESRSLFERKMGEPIDMRAIQEEAEAAEAAMQDELLQQFPDEDEERDEANEGEAADERGEASEEGARSGDDRSDDEGDEWDAEEGDDDLDDDDLDDDDLDDDDLDDDDLDDDDLDDDDLDDDDLDDDDEDDEEWDADEDEEDARGEDALDDDPESDHVKSGAPEPDERDDDPLPPRARDDADSPSLSDDFDDDDFEDGDPDEDVFENPDFDDDDDWDEEDDDDDWDDEED